MIDLREASTGATLVVSPRVTEAAARLHAARPEATIVLFGSHARGEARADSDVDFLVVLPQAPASARQEMARLSRLLYPIQVWADVLVSKRPARCILTKSGSEELCFAPNLRLLGFRGPDGPNENENNAAAF